MTEIIGQTFEERLDKYVDFAKDFAKENRVQLPYSIDINGSEISVSFTKNSWGGSDTKKITELCDKHGFSYVLRPIQSQIFVSIQ